MRHKLESPNNGSPHGLIITRGVVGYSLFALREWWRCVTYVLVEQVNNCMRTLSSMYVLYYLGTRLT